MEQQAPDAQARIQTTLKNLPSSPSHEKSPKITGRKMLYRTSVGVLVGVTVAVSVSCAVFVAVGVRV